MRAGVASRHPLPEGEGLTKNRSLHSRIGWKPHGAGLATNSHSPFGQVCSRREGLTGDKFTGDVKSRP